MADLLPDDDETTPRWVKALAIIGILLLLVVVILHLTGHAPSHSPW